MPSRLSSFVRFFRVLVCAAACWSACELSGTLGGSAQAAESHPQGLDDFMLQRGYLKIPLKHGFRNKFFAAGKLRGTRVSFLIDTGARDVVVDTRKAGKFKSLGKADTHRHFAYSQVSAPVESVLLDRMELSGILISNQPALVWDLHKQREVRTGTMIPVSNQTETEDVILGMNFLEPTCAVLDCVAPALYIRAQAPTDELRTNMAESFKMSGFIRLDADKAKSGTLLAKGEVNGREAVFIVDTGAPFTGCDELQLKDFALADREGLGKMSDLGGATDDLRHTTIRSLKLGALELSDFPVGVSRFPDVEAANQSLKTSDATRVLGLLGPDILYRSGALIDCSNGAIYLRRGANR